MLDKDTYIMNLVGWMPKWSRGALETDGMRHGLPIRNVPWVINPGDQNQQTCEGIVYQVHT